MQRPVKPLFIRRQHPDAADTWGLLMYMRHLGEDERIWLHDCSQINDSTNICDLLQRWGARHRQDAYALAPMRIVPGNRLLATQTELYVSRLIAILSGSEVPDMTDFAQAEAYCSPWCIKLGRKYYYVMNGHHRTWLQLALGQRAVLIRVFDADYWFAEKPISDLFSLSA